MRRALLIFLILIILVGGFAGWITYSIYTPYQGFAAPGVFVEIPKGASIRSISRLLADNGVVRSSIAFELLARRHSRRKLEAGEYYFDHPDTALGVFETLASGRVFEISVTVPEGYNSFQIADLLETKGLVIRDAFLAGSRDPSPIHDLAPGAPSVEGFLFPATYQFPRHVTAEQVIAAMTLHFREEWAKLIASNPPSGGRSVEQIVTLASLVESETPKADERPMVAGVFENRLRKRMLLDCDPTVVYALEKANAYKGALTTSDLRVNSPYNTYKFAGLPPGPIANPGEASLRAAIEPPAVEYLYFVADTEGGHFFARTLAEHNRNVARYHQLLRQKNTKEPAPPSKARKRP
jgi:UPF0755 protein